MNTKLVLKLNGFILLFDAIAMLLPVSVAIYYKESAGLAFLPAIIISLVIGIPLSLLTPKNKSLYAREGLVTVAIASAAFVFFSSSSFVLFSCAS